MTREYCQSCRAEIPTESGHVCAACAAANRRYYDRHGDRAELATIGVAACALGVIVSAIAALIWRVLA